MWQGGAGIWKGEILPNPWEELVLDVGKEVILASLTSGRTP